MNKPEVIIKSRNNFSIDFNELWSFRELFYTLAWRDIKVRYKQTGIGAVWAMVQPFILMVVFTLFFGRVAGIATGDIPYPIFAFTGLLFWNLFSNSLSAASESLVGNQAMIQKIYFPRIIMPIATVAVFVIDFLFALLVLAALMVYYSVTPSILGIILVIPAICITLLSSAGLGLAFASINVKYRDVRYALPFFTQLLLFVTPVIYPSAILGEYQWLWYFNPMAGVVETMRVGILGTGDVHWNFFGASLLASIVIFLLGVIVFNRTEKYFADII